MDKESLTALQASKIMKRSVARVQQLCRSGDLAAVKFGAAWSINAADIPRRKVRRRGRPKGK